MVTKQIPISEILIGKNYRDVSPPSIKDADILQLSESISQVGQQVPILIRPSSSDGSKYDLIFGHRRILACQILKLETITAEIRNIPDGDILEIQVTENLQRKDVHPLDEGKAFSELMKTGILTNEVSKRFGRSETYIAQRLSLLNLLPSFQKQFKEGIVSISQALLLSRLTEENQKHVEKQKLTFNQITAIQLNKWTEENLMHNLSEAKWQLDDAALYPKAGACSVCPKRSSAAGALFTDLDSKKGDRCLDGVCFAQKADLFLIAQLKINLETAPELRLVAESHYPILKVVVEAAKDMKVKILKQYDEWREDKYHVDLQGKAKGFYVNGPKAGQVITIFIKGEKDKTDSTGKLVKEDVKEVQKKIGERLKRSEELDAFKIHKEIMNALCEKGDHLNGPIKDFEKPGLKLQPIDRGIMVFLLLFNSNFNIDRYSHSAKDFKLGFLPSLEKDEQGKYAPKLFEKLMKITDDQLALIIRAVAFDKFHEKGRNIQSFSPEDTVLYLIADYLKVDIKGISAAQNEVKQRRLSNAEKKITKLKEDAKPKKEKAPAGKKEHAQKPAKKKAPVKRAPVKKSPVKKAARKK